MTLTSWRIYKSFKSHDTFGDHVLRSDHLAMTTTRRRGGGRGGIPDEKALLLTNPTRRLTSPKEKPLNEFLVAIYNRTRQRKTYKKRNNKGPRKQIYSTGMSMTKRFISEHNFKRISTQQMPPDV